MSNVQATMKSANQLIISLADHQKFNSGQISYIVREQIEKPKLEENFDRLLKMNQDVCVLDDTNSGHMCNQCDKFKDELTNKLTILVDRTSKLLEVQEIYKKKETDTLGPTREALEIKRQQLDREMKIKLDNLSESLVSAELDLQRKYLKFEENLRSAK